MNSKQERQTSDRNQIPTAVFLTIAFVLLLSLNPFSKKIPEGLPLNYYDRIEILEDYDTNIYIYSDVIDLNEHYGFFELNSINPTSGYQSDTTFIIIDMNKFIENYDDASNIEALFNSTCSYIVIANYHSSNTNYVIDFYELTDKDSDLVFYKNNELCESDFNKHSFSDSFPSIVYLNYAIFDTISRIYGEQE